MVSLVPLPSKLSKTGLEAEEEEGEGNLETKEKGPSPSPSLLIINFSTRQLAGNISRYLSNWKRITSNNFLLSIISSGYKIQFPIDPYQSKPIVSVPSKSNFEIIEGQNLDHLESRAISICPFVEGQPIY